MNKCITIFCLFITTAYGEQLQKVDMFDISRNRSGFIAKCKPFYERPKKYPTLLTGAWSYTNCDGQYNFDFYIALAFVDLMHQVYAKLKLEKGISKLNIVEFGAGCGCYSQMWKSYPNLDILALEGNPAIAELTRGEVRHMDLTTLPSENDALSTWNELEDIHIVICLEVMEHIPKQYQEIAIRNLLRRRPDYLFLSWASRTSGQGHVNIREQEYVEHLMSAKYGYDKLDKASSAIRDAPSTAWYFANTFMAFHRTSPASPRDLATHHHHNHRHRSKTRKPKQQIDRNPREPLA